MNVFLVHIGILSLFFVATTSPMVIIMFNERFRIRIKDILRCQLNPNHVTTSRVATRNIAANSHHQMPLQRPGNGEDITNSTNPPPPSVLYNNWIAQKV